MSELRFLSKGEQLAEYLRGELARGRWEGEMPGRPELVAEFGVNQKTVEDAMKVLERDGIVAAQGVGKRRKILHAASGSPRQLQIGFLIYAPEDRDLPYHVDLVHRLTDAGHHPVIAGKTLTELGMDVQRVQQAVKNIQADAWVVQGGSHAIVSWLAEQGKPVMAQFGRFIGLPVAGVGVRKIPCLRKLLRRLHELGHRRIVMMVREERRKPFPAAYEQAFLNEMQALGIQTGPYHLPDWENTIAGFHQRLDSLLLHTPPTAMILSEARLFMAAQMHLARRGLIAPRDISLVCDDPDDAFTWCDPPISHMSWDYRPLVSRIIRWADRVARGQHDIRQRFTHAVCAEGGTIGPAPQHKP